MESITFLSRLELNLNMPNKRKLMSASIANVCEKKPCIMTMSEQLRESLLTDVSAKEVSHLLQTHRKIQDYPSKEEANVEPKYMLMSY